MVMLNGRLFEAATLAQVAPVAKPGPKYFFEDLQRGSGTPLAVEAIMASGGERRGVRGVRGAALSERAGDTLNLVYSSALVGRPAIQPRLRARSWRGGDDRRRAAR